MARAKKFSGRVGTTPAYTETPENTSPREYLWTVLTPQGFEFSIHIDRETADYWADRVHGSVIPYVAHEKAVPRSYGLPLDSDTLTP